MTLHKLIPALSAAIFLLAFTGTASADDPKAREIMNKVDTRDDGDNRISQTEMILIDKHGKKRIRKLQAFSKDFGEDIYNLMFFIAPADVKNTGFLTYDYDASGKSDDQWLYMPALRKTKRIANEDKSGSFMGSDFNYYDMSKRDLDKYDFKLLKEGEVRGKKVWIIESLPKTRDVIDESGYMKSMVFVRQDNYVVVRAAHWMKDGGKMRFLDVKKLELIDNVWMATETTMTTKKGKTVLHKTILKQNDVKFNNDLDENMFTVRSLEKGL